MLSLKLILSILIVFIFVSNSTSKINNEVDADLGILETPKHIVFAHQLSSWSHCLPMMSYSEVLLERGHNVTLSGFSYITQIAEQYKASNPKLRNLQLLDLGDQGSSFLEFMHTAFEKMVIYEQTPLTMFSSFKLAFSSTYPLQFQALSNFVQDNKVDLFACDFFAFAAMDVATVNNITSIITFPTSVDHFGLSSHPYYPHFLASQIYRNDDSFFNRIFSHFVLPLQYFNYSGDFIRNLNTIRSQHRVPETLLFHSWLRSFYSLSSSFDDFAVFVQFQYCILYINISPNTPYLAGT